MLIGQQFRYDKITIAKTGQKGLFRIKNRLII